jgi:hypothetical protein
VKVIGLLSWYEEPVSWLAETVASAAKLCDHLIAVDGPYAEFPFALKKPASGTEQAETILHTAAGAGIGCTIHASRQPWWGNEVEKRSFMFELAQTMTTPDDWLLVIDADEVLDGVPEDTRDLLEKAEADVAEVNLWVRGDQETVFIQRRLFRALRGITYRDCHYVVTAPTETGVKILSGDERVHHLEPAELMLDLRMEHRSAQRTALRNGMKNQYYAKLPELEHVSDFG